MACVDLDLSLKESFRDPSQFRHNHHIKQRAPKFPDLWYKQTQQPLWIDGGHNHPCLQEELRRNVVTHGESFASEGDKQYVHRNGRDRSSLMESIKACGIQKDLRTGSAIHSYVLEKGFLKKDTSLGNAILSMYIKCGALARAQEIFDELPSRNVVTWNALIAGFAQNGLGSMALNFFERMKGECLSPNAITFLCILKACGSIGKGDKGEEIHSEISRQGLLEKDILLRTALVDMYVKCGMLVKAQEAFDEIPIRDVASWTALIDGYAEHGLGDEALNCYNRMRGEGLSPNAVTYLCILKACGSVGALEKGEEIHAEVQRQGLLGKDIILGTTLVDMYVKCGMLLKAKELFDELPARDIATWTSLMAGYANIGKVKTVLNLFVEMVGKGIEPNVVTFVVLLTACSHTGLVEEGQMYFDTISTVYSITPTSEHCTCVVDMYSRAGQFEKAISLIEKVPPSECLLLWWVLMGACGKWANVELGEWAFEHALRLNRDSAATYVSMRNMYVTAELREGDED